MPPKKRITKKAAAAAAAEAAALAAHPCDAEDGAVPVTEDVPALPDVEPERGQEQENTEPVVLQLLIPNDRMTEIVTTTVSQEHSKTDPEPYHEMDSFMHMPTMENSINGHHQHTTNGAHSMVCFWCCHPIVDNEYGMPIRYDSVHNSFTLYGCFCSLECASAHNFSMHMGCDRAWEIHSWIQLLARRYGLSGKVRPAPSKFLLKMFNGPLTIEEFRNAHKGLARTYVMNIPPFIHVASQMEILNTSFMSTNAAITTADPNVNKRI